MTPKQLEKESYLVKAFEAIDKVIKKDTENYPLGILTLLNENFEMKN